LLDKLQSDRHIALDQIFDTIASHFKVYQEPTTISQRICQRHEDLKALACDAIVLGTLLKGCVRAGIWPIPLYPYDGFTVLQVVKDVTAMQIYSLCEINKDGMHRGYGNEAKQVHDQVKHSMLSFKNSVQAALEGLDLNDYK
jgi:hypothetical protein